MTAATGFGGYVDFWGESEPGRVAICGWLGQPFKTAAAAPDLQVHIGTGEGVVQTRALGLVFARADVAAIGFGAILICDVPVAALDGLAWVGIVSGARTGRMQLAPSTQRLDRNTLQDALRPLLERAAPVDHRAVALAGLQVADDAYFGPGDGELALSVEAVLSCGTAGTLILGSVTGREPTVAQATLVHRRERVRLSPEQFVSGPWTEVSSGLVCMPLACLAHNTLEDAGAPRLELLFLDGRTARTSLKPPRRADGAALRVALAAFGAARDIDRVFDHVAGPAIGGLHAACRAVPVAIERHAFGAPAASPRASLVIPLHGRIDYMEVQLALFSAQPCMAGAELIYVVDDPPRHDAALALARSCLARFGTACRVLLPGRNLGFAAASNTGLREAAGTYVCFLNSDAFSDTGDWLDRLIGRLDADASLGIVGPLLLLPDGSVQHEGMVLECLASHGGWRFPRHARKGLRPERSGVQRAQAITGACMVLRRSLAEQLGGFDEAFVIGDFEDADLCARAAKAGFACAVDRDVRLLHLERKSQGADAPWRAAATNYNAWLHKRRWFSEPKGVAVPARRRRG